MTRMGMATKRRGLALLLLGLMMIQLVPAPAAGYHQGSAVTPPDAEDPPQPRLPETFPTVDAAIQSALARQREAVQALNERLRESGLDPDRYAPAFPADVFADGVDAETRVGGVGPWTSRGDAWNVQTGAGRDGTDGWTIRNATTGRYGTMDALLLSPLLDLSAYPVDSYPFLSSNEGLFGLGPRVHQECTTQWALVSRTIQQTGLLPASVLNEVGSTCDRVQRASPTSPLADQVLLTFAHRVALPEGLDGAQVIAFPGSRVPASLDQGILLEPLSGYGAYANVSALQTDALPGRGFTGVANWSATAFDLTPYAGQALRLGFRVVGSPGADVSPTYFSSLHGIAPGWDVDDLKVVAPAYANNLKVVAIDGTGHILPGERVYRAPPGGPVNLTVHLLNAAATEREARMLVTSDGPGNASFQHTVSRVLRPGEVWSHPVDFVAPLEEDVPFSVRAQAWNPDPTGNRSIPDPTFADNRGERPMQASAVRRVALALEPSELMVDDEQPVRALATVRNDGNVPLDVTVSLNETYVVLGNETSTDHPPKSVTLAPGEERALEWSVTSSARREHRLVARATAEGAQPQWANASYHVHASPPPVFFNGDGQAPDPNWTMHRANVPIPENDEGMWVGRFDSRNGHAVLRALPTGEPKDAGGYTDLELSVRYVAVRNVRAPIVTLVYTAPAGRSTEGNDVGVVVWSRQLPFVHSSRLPLERAGSLTWQTATFQVNPSTAAGYLDEAWAAGLLEVHLIADGGTGASSGFFLDDLRLTGVPRGKDAAWRVDLIHVTGQAGDGGVAVAPSSCPSAQTGQTIHCWERWSRERAIGVSTNPAYIRWSASDGGSPPMLDGARALWSYVGSSGDRAEGSFQLSRDPNRLVSPPMVLRQAVDPLLTFDHWYALPGFPNDGREGATYDIQQVSYVEVQYLQDDGTWSPFHRLVPEGGYSNPLEKNTANDTRGKTATSYVGGDGYFYPARCNLNAQEFCEPGTNGFYWNFGDDENNKHLVEFPPLPVQQATIRLYDQDSLGGVNLSGRTIRLGFMVPDLSVSTVVNTENRWTVGDVRVTPVTQFAIDAAVTSLDVEVPYDWREIGVGPGTNATLNVTVRNVGRYAEAFALNVTVSELDGALAGEPVTRTIGVLGPGENRTILIDWPVPQREGVFYEIVARVEAAADGVEDENDLNDQVRIGKGGDLFARTVRDVVVRSRVFPEDGRETLSRWLPIFVHNVGNVPIEDLVLTRTVHRLEGSGRVPVDGATIRLTQPLPPTTEPQRIESLKPRIDEREFRTEDAFVNPGAVGRYLYSVVASTGAPEKDVDNNAVRAFFSAKQPLKHDDFDGPLRWTTNDASVWGLGPGFQSVGGLLAANRTSGAIPPGTDAWIESPLVRLSNARQATVNVFQTYDLERSYDGGRLEVSIDGGLTWHVVPPLVELGEEARYPVPLIGSNPLALDAGPNATVYGISGNARHAEVQIEGWVPASYDLMAVPALVEQVPFERLLAPREDERPLVNLSTGRWAAGWMQTDPTLETGTWEIQNLTEGIKARHGKMFWSGYANGMPAQRELSRGFLLPDLDANSTLVLSWWDLRAGGTAERWQGVGADYDVLVYQFDDVGNRVTRLEGATLAPVAHDGNWNRLSMEIDPINVGQPLYVEFVLRSTAGGVNSTGWVVEDIDLRAVKLEDGILVTTLLATGDDEQDAGSWTRNEQIGWRRVGQIAPRGATWEVVKGTTADGLATDMWRLDLKEAKQNVDTRLVTPEVDLTKLGSTRALLRLGHDYDLLHQVKSIMRGARPWEGFAYQAAAVEVQVFNRTTGAWDPWKQLFELPTPPSAELIESPRENHALEARPYTTMMPDVGSSFDSFPRAWLQWIGTVGNVGYYRTRVSDAAFAFTGKSDGSPYNVSTFDLSPFVGERVRFGFHAWTGGDADGGSARERHWRIADVQVVGVVMSARDATLRFRLGTDASGLQGSWSIDQYEVTGVPYLRSIGVHVEERDERVSPDGVARVRGYLQNYGPDDRRLVALGLVSGGFARATFVGDTFNTTVPGYEATLVVPEITRAGTNGSIVPFELLLYPGAATGQRNVVLQVLEAGIDGGLAYAPVQDDVPGRARRVWTLDVERVSHVSFGQPEISPRHLAGPGVASATLVGVNDGTLPQTLTATVVWRDSDNRTIGNETKVELGIVEPGQTFRVDAPSKLLGRVGNHTVWFTIGGVERSATVRVGVGDVALRTGFDGGPSGWTATPSGWWRFEAPGRDGGASALFGTNDTEWSAGAQGLEQQRRTGGTLRSGTIDLRHAGEGATISFWHRPMFNASGRVQVNLTLAPTPTLAGCSTVLLNNLGGRASTWQHVEIPLRGLSCGGQPLTGRNASLEFYVNMADGQGWRVDDVVVVDAPLRVSPGSLEFDIVDSAVKRYPFLVENPGLSPRTITTRLDPHASKLTPLQSAWFTTEPERLVLQPGESAVVTLQAATPAARGAFPQAVRAVLAAVDAAAPSLPSNGSVALSFAPLPRQDVQAVVAADGVALGAARAPLEEGVPHELSVTLTNQGVEASAPTSVLLQAVRDRNGEVLLDHREEIPGLGPYASTEESYVFSASWRPDFGERENFTIRLVVDPDRRQVDYDRSNDDLRLPVRVVRLVRPDLVVDPAGFLVSDGDGRRVFETAPGALLRVDALVRNDGFAAARDVTVRVLAGNSVLKEELVPLLRPGEGYRIRVNQFAPDASVSYRVIAFTTDLELSAANNEHTLEIPVYPPEILLAPLRDDLRIEPGEELRVPLEVRNEGPHPVLLNLSVGGAGGVYALERAQVALAPGETRVVHLDVAIPSHAAAGERLVVLKAAEEGLVRAQRTLPFEVAARPSVTLLPLGARGAPSEVRLEVEVANTGNVPLAPDVVAYDGKGAELARFPAGALERGRSRLVVGEIPLPAGTPPGRVPVRVVVEDATLGTLAESVLDAHLSKWGHVRANADALAPEDAAQGYDVRVAFEGNAPTQRRVLLYGLPAGVEATVTPDRLQLSPGESTTLRVRFGTDAAPAGGLHAVQLALVEDGAEARPEAILPNLTTLALDLRVPVLESLGVERRGQDAPREGDTVLYAVKVRNVGDRPARDVPVGLYVDGVLAARASVEALAPGETREVTLAWTAQPGEHGVIVALDPHGGHSGDSAAFSESLRVGSSLPQQIAAGASGQGLPLSVIALSVLAILGFGYLILRRRKA